jgi:hypothetical protein
VVRKSAVGAAEAFAEGVGVVFEMDVAVGGAVLIDADVDDGEACEAEAAVGDAAG